MKKWTFLFLAMIWSLPLPAQKAEELQIFQTEKKIVVDGNLEDWGEGTEIPIKLAPEGTLIEPSANLTVTARFAFDAENFYAAVKAADDRFEFPDRSWRYGDGLMLTFVDPSQGNESDRFSSYGFSLRGKEEVKVLVNRDGEYFPRAFIKDIQLKIVTDANKKIITYEIAIPWIYLPSVRPLIQQKWAVNLIYIDRDIEERKIVQLFADPNYDTEETNKRKGWVCRFVPRLPLVPEFQVALNGNHFFEDEEKTLTLAVNAPADEQGWELMYILSPAENLSPVEKSLSFQKGINLLRFSLDAQSQPSGLYDLSLGIRDGQGALKFSEDKQYFLLDRKELETLGSKVEAAKKSDLFSKDTIFRESLPTLEIRGEWIKQFMENSPPFADIETVKEWHDETKELTKNVEEGKPALFPNGQIVRLAHRSAIDGTLQPYSLAVPEGYDQKTAFPLLVTLHGSGVDEKRSIMSLAAIYYSPKIRARAGDFIILAPQARGLSDWYAGDSGQDVLECIEHVKELYKVDEKTIILDGFSMGAYGAWRLALLNPKMFKAVIIRSGRVSPPEGVKGENILELLDNAKNLNILVVHGDRDNAVPVDEARKAVEKLKELKANFKYLEVKGGGHGDYDKWSEIFSWLEDIMGGSRVKPKPPHKKPR